ncbi:MAG TPA: hypothetical protein GX005_09660 [Bacteroidales bacterium]|nr:hypothetical protein [Bacteroidales bacterium]
MSERKFASTLIRDSEDKLGLTPEQVSQLLADVNTSLAKTKGFTKIGDVTLPDGLIFTSLIKLLDVGNDGDEMAGISGIAGALKNNPAFWAGGAYEQAFALISFLSKMSAGVAPSDGEYDALASISLLHNGAAKIGDFIVEESGRITLVDPETGKPRLIFNASNIPFLSDLLSTSYAGDSVDNSANSRTWVYDPNELPHPTLPSNYKAAINLPNSINVTHDNSDITFNATTITLNAATTSTTSLGATAEALVVLNIGTQSYSLGATFVTVSKDNQSGNSSMSIPNRVLKGLPKGMYSVQVILKADDGITSLTGTISASTLSWEFRKEDVRYFQFGLDGMMAYFSDNHIHFTETTGWDVRGKSNMPGVLASGTISSGGVLSNEWGAKVNYGQTITGGYRIFLKDMTHNKYSVQVTPHTNVTFRVSTKTSTYFDILGTGAADFVVFGSNY